MAVKQGDLRTPEDGMLLSTRLQGQWPRPCSVCGEPSVPAIQATLNGVRVPARCADHPFEGEG